MALLSARVDEEDKVMFISFCDSVGITPSAAINLFVKTVNREHRIPFEIKIDDPFSPHPINCICGKPFSSFEMEKAPRMIS